MRADPRCPFCDGKVSAAAEWCMHCGRDFDGPVVDGEADREHGGGTTTIQRERERHRRRGHEQRRQQEATARPGPSDLDTVDPRLVPDLTVVDPGRAGRFLTGLGAVGVLAVAGLELPLAPAGAGLAVLAWVGSIVSLARRRSGFAAMQYGSYGAMTLLVFVSFALALAAEGRPLLALLCTLVPTGFAALVVAGLGPATDLGGDPNREMTYSK